MADSPGLTSLAGLAMSGEINSVSLSGPELVDLVALASVTRAREITLEELGVEDLDALRSLRAVDHGLTIEKNSRLANVDGLSGLTRVGQLSIVGNDALTHLPRFPELRQLANLHVAENAVLEVGPGLPSLTHLEPSPFEFSADPFLAVSITSNPRLAELGGLSALRSAPWLYVTSNDSLREIDFSGLSEVAFQLSVARNPLLPKSQLVPLGRVQATRRNLRGNLGDVIESDCAWPDDGVCDEAFGLCDVGTDPDCQ